MAYHVSKIQRISELSKLEHEYIEMCFESAQANKDAVPRLRHGAVLFDPKGSCSKREYL